MYNESFRFLRLNPLTEFRDNAIDLPFCQSNKIPQREQSSYFSGFQERKYYVHNRLIFRNW